MDVLKDLEHFLNESPTPWHTVKEIERRLDQAGFHQLDEKKSWNLVGGKNYFFSREGSLCAFLLPKDSIEQAILLASHTDSPGLKLKPHPIYSTANMIQCGVEVYGAPLLNSWLNRDLILAGKILVSSHQKIQEQLIFLKEPVLCIPQLAIHLDRDVNEKGLILNKQEHLPPILGLSSEEKLSFSFLETLLKKTYSFDSLLSFDLFLVPKESAQFIGFKKEMIASYRIDNLASAHAAVLALTGLKKPHQHTLQMGCFFNHEEVGSSTKEGASSPLIQDAFQRIYHSLKVDLEKQVLIKNHSLCISLDMAHALNPNYPHKHDPHHQPLLGKGIVLKHNANQRYASDATSLAVVIDACQKLNLPYQSFVSKSDLACGSTIGPLIAENLGIKTVDIGSCQLSMHSIREVMAGSDHIDMITLLHYLLQEVRIV